MPKRFIEPDDTYVFTTKFVLSDGKDITVVYHDADDGAWQFHSNDDYEDFDTVAKIVGLGEIIQMDNTVLEIADMPPGYFAQRTSKEDRWVVRKISS